jgi:putative ATPase
MIDSSNLVQVHGPIKVGECVYTSPGNLSQNKVKYIIHTVGPEYNKNKSALFNSALLYNAIYNALTMANKLGCTSISFPAISSGIFGFPKHLCAQVFFCAIKDFIMSDYEHLINNKVFLQKIRMVNFDSQTTNEFLGEFQNFCKDYQSSMETIMNVTVSGNESFKPEEKW